MVLSELWRALGRFAALMAGYRVGKNDPRSAQNGYYQTEWPRRTRAYEYGVYTDQVLQNFFMPGMYVLTNLSAA